MRESFVVRCTTDFFLNACRVTVPVMDQLVPVMDQFSNVNSFSKKVDPGIICVKSHFEGSNLQDPVVKF